MDQSQLLPSKKTRYVWLDVCRTLAILSITCNHAIMYSFRTYTNTIKEFQSIPLWLSMVKAGVYVFSRLGVPIFLMITGTLFLGRDFRNKKVMKRFLSHNWFSLFITTEIWLFIIFWALCYLRDGSVLRQEGVFAAVRDCISTLLFMNQYTTGNLWYINMILVVYLMLPVISIALLYLDRKYFYYLVGFSLFSGMIIPNLNTLFQGLGMEYQLEFAPLLSDLFSIYMAYILIGYFISQGDLERFSSKSLMAVFSIIFILTAVFQFWTYSTELDYQVRYADIGVILAAACLFELIRRIPEEKIKKPGIYTHISKISLGIFFLHNPIMIFMRKILVAHEIKYLARFFILEAGSLAVSILIISVLGQIPFFRKVLFNIK